MVEQLFQVLFSTAPATIKLAGLSGIIFFSVLVLLCVYQLFTRNEIARVFLKIFFAVQLFYWPIDASIQLSQPYLLSAVHLPILRTLPLVFLLVVCVGSYFLIKSHASQTFIKTVGVFLCSFLICLASVVWWKGDDIAYVNIMKFEVLKALTLITILILNTFFTQFRKLFFPFLIIFLLTSLYLGNEYFVFFLLATIVFSPTLSLEKFLKRLTFLVMKIGDLYRQAFSPSLAALLTVLILMFYRVSFHSYFEGDEWVYFRFFVETIRSAYWPIEGFLKYFRPLDAAQLHITPITDTFFIFQYRFLQLNFQFYLICSLLLLIGTSLAFAKFVHSFTGSKQLALLSTLFFALNATHSQAVTWVIAAVNTQLPVMLGFLSLIYLIADPQKIKRRYLYSAICLLLALWSKETAVLFLLMTPIVYMLHHKSARGVQKLFGWHGIVAVIFILGQVFGRFNDPAQSKIDISLLMFRYVIFTLKSIAQTIIPSVALIDLGMYLTQMQFQYFNIEKDIRGSTYLNFIQGASVEYLSYGFALSFILLFLFLVDRKYRKEKVFVISYLLLGIIPILGITYAFAWWGYSSIVDSRHLYHLSPGLSIAMSVLILSIVPKLQRYIKIDQRVLIAFFVLCILGVEYHYLQKIIAQQQISSSFSDRRLIVQKLQKEVGPVPNKLILYTTSNKSYYGFAEWMLPFQTPVAQMLPVIFSREYNSQGVSYAPDFFADQYMTGFSKGLVAQGYYEKDGYGLGYFLEKNPLIKTLEQYEYSADMVYAFRYDGDGHSFENITGSFRADITQKLESRKMFKEWKRYGKKDVFTFLIDPEWSVEKKDNQFLILNKSTPLLSFEMFTPLPGEVFSEFTKKQLIAGKTVGSNYDTLAITPDLDLERLVYRPTGQKEIIFTYSGNNLLFYKIRIYDETASNLIFRTLEFSDVLGEVDYAELAVE